MTKHLQPLSVPTLREALAELIHELEGCKGFWGGTQAEGDCARAVANGKAVLALLTPEQHDALLGEGGQPAEWPEGITGSALVFEPGQLHIKPDGSAVLTFNEDDCEYDAEEGGNYWSAKIAASEVTEIRKHCEKWIGPLATKPASVPITDEAIEAFCTEYFGERFTPQAMASVKAGLEAAFSTLTPDDRLLGEPEAWAYEVQQLHGNWIEGFSTSDPKSVLSNRNLRNIRPLYALSSSPGECRS